MKQVADLDEVEEQKAVMAAKAEADVCNCC